jgi:hypothetical protein
MNAPQSTRPRGPGDMIFLCGCALGLLMLLLFPIRQVHRFAEHYRGAEACRMVKRHTFIAQSDSSQADHAVSARVEPVSLIPPRFADVIKPLHDYDALSPAPLLQLLMRMKRGSPQNQTDPLL